MTEQQVGETPQRNDRRKVKRRQRAEAVAQDRRLAERRKEPRRTLEWIEHYVQKHNDDFDA